MSFALNKRLRQGLRPGRLLLFFLILWLLCALFLFFHLQFLKNQIQKLEVQRLELGLDTYLRRSALNSGGKFVLESEPPREVDFIRLVRGREQLLLTGNTTMNFTGLVDLDPYTHGVWIDLFQPENSGTWILVSRKMSGGVVQAGNDDRSAGIAIYKRAVSVSFWSFCLASVPALFFSLFFTSLIRKPLQELQDDIERTLQQRSLPFPDRRPKDAELAPLYQQLGRVFQQNRQLINEMQSSLDNVAHDLRTPMSRLRAVAEYALQSEKSEPELYRNALSDCLEESERVMSMLKVMMSVAEAEAGTMRLELEKLDLTKTLEDVIGLYQYVAEEEQITVSCAGEKGLFVHADQTRLCQVWANLLDNGIKYGHESGTVRICVEKKEKSAIVRFYDDGMGISETEINRIWDRLYRGDRSRSRQGLGLGLNYVKAVVEAHGGEVQVKSKIREGSCFIVRLPLLAS
ncbi:MAG: HAMP domain-containing histidine kinase [Proteobacteria bacterium]|nr:HAMP domain-containing histidine kinase [Pseudomonadota bacterium]MBU1060045.1 HAMP domain-containing histidine kinase [Pseudomonadota bacterium]